MDMPGTSQASQASLFPQQLRQQQQQHTSQLQSSSEQQPTLQQRPTFRLRSRTAALNEATADQGETYEVCMYIIFNSYLVIYPYSITIRIYHHLLFLMLISVKSKHIGVLSIDIHT